MMKGRGEYLEKNVGLILKLDDEVEIYVDKYQYILVLDGKHVGFHASLDSVLEDLLSLKLKETFITNHKKDIAGLLETMAAFEQWALKLLAPLNTQALTRKIITNHNSESTKNEN